MSDNKKTRDVPDLNIAHDENGDPKYSGTMSDLMNDKELDEMQKEINYRTAFKCFRFMYWAMFTISFLMICVCINSESLDIYMLIAAFAIEIVDAGAYIYYAASTAKYGAMNPKFAKANAKAGWAYLLVSVMYISMALVNNAPYYVWIYIAILYLSFGGTAFFAKKNQKVIEKQLSESEEE